MSEQKVIETERLEAAVWRGQWWTWWWCRKYVNLNYSICECILWTANTELICTSFFFQALFWMLFSAFAIILEWFDPDCKWHDNESVVICCSWLLDDSGLRAVLPTAPFWQQPWGENSTSWPLGLWNSCLDFLDFSPTSSRLHLLSTWFDWLKCNYFCIWI